MREKMRIYRVIVWRGPEALGSMLVLAADEDHALLEVFDRLCEQSGIRRSDPAIDFTVQLEALRSAAEQDEPMQLHKRVVQRNDEAMGHTIDEDMIGRLVEDFYRRIQADTVLRPIFQSRITEWESHLSQMKAFWASVVLKAGTYEGRPFEKHLDLPVDGTHFDRWLSLFEAAARQVCPPSAASEFVDRARRIADSLELGVAHSRGKHLQLGERLSL